jgi:RNA polymerase sigma-70 factor (ECF subfamily)
MTSKQFENLINQHKDKLFRFAFSILKNSDEAKDAVQEVVLKLWKNRHVLDKTKNLESYCLNTIKNYCFDEIRKQKHRQEFQKSIRYEENEENKVEYTDLIDSLKKEVCNLPEQQRIAIELKDFQGFEYQEISEILGLSINAIRANVSRGRKKLFEIFKEELKDA